MTDDETAEAFRAHVLEDLHLISKVVHALARQQAATAAQVAAIHQVLVEFGPVLAMFRPGSGVGAVQQAGVAKAMRKRLGRGGNQ